MTNCERCGRPRKVSAFGLCDDCQIELAGQPNPVDPAEVERFRAALEAAPEPDAPRNHSMDCYRERLTAQYAEHAQPAVDRTDPAESNLAAYAAMMQGHAQESEARALAEEKRVTELEAILRLVRDTFGQLLPAVDRELPFMAFIDVVAGQVRILGEDKDAAEWAVGELRAALEGLLDEPEIERQRCPRCGASYSTRPVRHAAGCAVQAAEDALKDTADVGELARRLAAATDAHRALVEAARELCEAGTEYARHAVLEFDSVNDVYVVDGDRLDALRAVLDALDALEGEGDRE